MKTERYFRKYQRLRGFDYTNAATYFITICSHNREHTLGDIIFADMDLSPIGEIAVYLWEETITLRQELIPHAFIVMPNHVHALFSLNPDALANSVATHCNASSRPSGNASNHLALYRRPHSVSSIIGGYKGATTREARTQLDDPTLIIWQPRFHDRIVRSNHEFDVIVEYIESNPARWEQDRFNQPMST